jgi:hypothetical protein
LFGVPFRDSLWRQTTANKAKGRERMPAPTPRRAGRQAKPGSRFMADVLADNVRGHRLLQRLEQADVAGGMNKLGHPWKAATVSEVERGQRNVTVDELVALGLVLETPPFALLDPVPIAGGLGPDLDVGTAKPLPTMWARRWLQGEVKAKIGERDDGTTFVLGWETTILVDE